MPSRLVFLAARLLPSSCGSGPPPLLASALLALARAGAAAAAAAAVARQKDRQQRLAVQTGQRGHHLPHQSA